MTDDVSGCGIKQEAIQHWQSFKRHAAKLICHVPTSANPVPRSASPGITSSMRLHSTADARDEVRHASRNAIVPKDMTSMYGDLTYYLGSMMLPNDIVSLSLTGKFMYAGMRKRREAVSKVMNGIAGRPAFILANGRLVHEGIAAASTPQEVMSLLEKIEKLPNMHRDSATQALGRAIDSGLIAGYRPRSEGGSITIPSALTELLLPPIPCVSQFGWHRLAVWISNPPVSLSVTSIPAQVSQALMDTFHPAPRPNNFICSRMMLEAMEHPQPTVRDLGGIMFESFTNGLMPDQVKQIEQDNGIDQSPLTDTTATARRVEGKYDTWLDETLGVSVALDNVVAMCDRLDLACGKDAHAHMQALGEFCGRNLLTWPRAAASELVRGLANVVTTRPRQRKICGVFIDAMCAPQSMPGGRRVMADAVIEATRWLRLKVRNDAAMETYLTRHPLHVHAVSHFVECANALGIDLTACDANAMRQATAQIYPADNAGPAELRGFLGALRYTRKSSAIVVSLAPDSVRDANA